MKTQSKIKGLLAIIFTVFMFFNGKSQCPYAVYNTLGCSIIVDIQVFTGTPANCNSCTSILNVTIPANSSYPINCGGCVPVCNIEVTVTDIGGTTVGVSASDFYTPQTLPSVCGASGIFYSSATNTFKVY